MKKIMITGGAGFVGSQLGLALSRENDVILVDNLSYGKLDNLFIEGNTFGSFQCLDIRSEKLIDAMESVDVVFHLAAIAPLPDCQDNPSEAYSVNLSGTANVLEAARIHGVKKFVFASTSAVYEGNEKFPLEENDEVNPYLVYSTSKYYAEHLVKSFGECYGLNYTILRFFNVYGPHQDVLRKQPPLMGYIIKELYNERVPNLHSSGEQKRDYVYIDDLVDICSKVMMSGKSDSEILNVCSGEAYSVKEIYSYISKYMGKSNVKANYRDSSMFWEKYPGLYQGELKLNPLILDKEVNKHSLGSKEKANNLLGWEPKVNLEEGIERSVKYGIKMLGDINDD